MCNYSDGVEMRGIEKGIGKGEWLKLIQLICRKLEKGKRPEVIAEELEEDRDVVEKICAAVGEKGLDADIEAIYQAVSKEKDMDF